MNAPLAPSPEAPRGALLVAGVVLGGRFRLVEAIGKGGFGEVWCAEELLPDGAPIRKVALKLLAAQTDVSAWGGEAKLLASFSHPSLVTIFAAGVLTDPAAAEIPFVAMERLEGETLGARLARVGPASFRRVLAWARDVASALDVIHTRGVVHLDLKPSNLFLTDGGVVKVLDFGISQRAGRAAAPLATSSVATADASIETAEFLAESIGGSEPPPSSASVDRVRASSARVIGTPGFMAPEVIEQRAVTPAADAYALAACIVQLATGSLPQDVPDAPPSSSDSTAKSAWLAEVRMATSVGKLRKLDALPRGVAALCERLLALDPSARGAPPGGLRALVEEAWERPFGVPDPPYVGLGVFGPKAEGMLFGRSDDVARLGEELVRHRVLVLQGVSGSGKSSLAVAGLAPWLEKHEAERGRDARTIVLRPSADPDAALLAAVPAIEGGLEALVASCDEQGSALVLVCDQLEELVTQASPEKRGRFVALLAEAPRLASSAPIYVIGTLREDFTSPLLAIEPLGERLRDALRFVGAPTTSAVREIVEQPARLAAVRVEGGAEVAAEVQAALREGEGRLPLVALALSSWWAARKEGPLTYASFRRLGGVKKIFADLADGVHLGLDERAQAEARAALVELCLDGRTKARIPKAKLRDRARDKGAFERAIAAFEGQGLLVETAGSIEVVHEFLFTAWERLDRWLEGEKASRRIAEAIAEDARKWDELGRPEARLPSLAETGLAEIALEDASLGADDEALVRGWVAAEAKRRGRRRVERVGLAGALTLMIALALGAWGKTVSEAQARADQAKREAATAAAVALEKQERATAAEHALEGSRAENQRVADMAVTQREELERLLRDAESEVKQMAVKCSLVKNAPRIRSGGCPPGDPLCAAESAAEAPR